MKIKALVASVSIAAAAVIPVMAGTTAGAADTVQVRVVNAYSYGAGHPFDIEFCLDGESLGVISTEQQTGPIEVAPGTHQFGESWGDGCGPDDADYHTIEVPDTDAASVIWYWAEGEQAPVVVLEDDLSCTPAGQGRVVLRNLATIWTENGTSPIDVDATGPDGEPVTLATGLEVPEQATQLVDAGTYTDLDVTLTADGTPPYGLDDPDLTVGPGTVLVRTYYGGVDGDVGSFDNVIEVDTCDEPTTTIVPESTTTTLAPATTVPAPHTAPVARPVAAQPAYTG